MDIGACKTIQDVDLVASIIPMRAREVRIRPVIKHVQECPNISAAVDRRSGHGGLARRG